MYIDSKYKCRLSNCLNWLVFSEDREIESAIVA